MHPLCQDIEAGRFDPVLEQIGHAVKRRLDGQKLGEEGLAIGDHCRFTYQTSPKYLNDYGVEILSRQDSGEVIVKALAPRARGRRFRVRPSSLEKVT